MGTFDDLAAEIEDQTAEPVLDPTEDLANDPVESANPASAEPEHAFTEGQDEPVNTPQETPPAA